MKIFEKQKHVQDVINDEDAAQAERRSQIIEGHKKDGVVLGGDDERSG